MSTQEEKNQILVEALAEYFECEPEQVHGYLIGCEHTDDNGVTFSSIWSNNVPWWGLNGYVGELQRHVDNQRGGSDNGQVPMPPRAVRRGARRRG